MPDKGDNKPPTRLLRVEAGPADWVELDSAQRTAYLRIGTMVAEAVSDPSPNRNETGTRLRRTQTAFVMGGRGTGKTTVLETLRRDSLQGRVSQSKASNEGRDDTSINQARERDDLLSNINGRIVWLETLDMEPLPPDANLLAAILVRLEDAAKAFGTKEGPQAGRARGLLEPSSDYHAALLDLQRLQTDVALAWDGNLQDRKGHLDPDTYAVEMMRIEQSRLSLNRKFAATFESLAEHVFRSARVHDPLFVLPVDDFDLNPPTCLDLLRVLRLISIPRLFTIILGDLQVAQTVLSLKLSNDIGTIADSRIYRDMLAIDPGTVGVLAGDVAANAIRKLLPPAHRVELRPMSVWEALNFRPLGASSEPALHELFGQCAVYPLWKLPSLSGVKATSLEQSQTASLRQLLMAPPLTSVLSSVPVTQQPVAFDVQAVKAAVYSGRRVIEAPPRRVADMWLGVRKKDNPDVEDDQALDDVLAHFAELCRGALRETLLFSPDELRSVDHAIKRNVGGWTLRAMPILISAETAEVTPIELAREETVEHPPERQVDKRKMRPRSAPSAVPRVRVFEALDWRISVRRVAVNRRPGTQLPSRPSPPGMGGLGGPDPWGEQSPAHTVTDGTVSALILYHDLLAFTRRDGTFVSPLLNPSSLRIDWAITEWSLAGPVPFNWPPPPASTFFDIDCFKAAWNRAITSPEVTGETRPERCVERLMFAWIAVGTSVLMRTHAEKLTSPGEPVLWNELTKKLDALATASLRETSDTGREWLLGIAELLMPEMAAPITLQEPFHKAQNLISFWRRHKLGLQQRRADRLSELAAIDHVLAESLREAGSLAREFAPARQIKPHSEPPAPEF